MDMKKIPYEISLWEDELTFVGESGEEYVDITEVTEPIAYQYYKEVKLCTIGSDTMDSPARCVNAKLSRKVNGENTLTFTMYYRYWDYDTEDFVYNPFNSLMVNERKVKLRLGPAVEETDDESCKWFDFIIKNVQENSDSKAFTYTCKDQFVNELSKSGFELILDNELENNMGTISFLADKILAGSDWALDNENTENLKQYKEEPLYRVGINQAIEATNLETGDLIEIDSEDSVVYIYVFYSNINDKKSQWQFLYTEDEFKINDDLVIDREEHPNYIIDVKYEDNGYPAFVAINPENDALLVELSLNYRGERLVRQVSTKYDATIDKYVGVYLKDGDENKETYYGYTQSEYVTSGAITNYVANPSNFTSTSGWQTDANQLHYEIETTETSENGVTKYQSFLEIDFTDKQSVLAMNAGIGGNRSSIGEFVEGEKYVVRIKYKTSLTNTEYVTDFPTIKISEYDFDDNKNYKLSDNPLFIFSEKTISYTNDIDKNGNYIVDSGYVYGSATCSRSVSKTELSAWNFKIGLFFNFNHNGKIYIEDVQIFKYETYEEEETERLCVPGGKLHSEIKTKYIYYTPNPDMKSIDDLKPVYSDYNNSDDFIQQYGTEGDGTNQFTKVRSISAKESNRFNLIQTLCETFECWPKFTVKRNQATGQIYYGKDLGLTGEEEYRQQKFVSFHEFVGVENQIGFRYGINSKSIQRTIDSSAIVSKMIVKDNANEFAPNGFCSIARASENPSGENFLLNFDHYVRHRLLDFDVVTNDLYVDVNGYLGYYKQLKRINIDRDNKIDIQSGLLIDISNYEAAYTTYKTSYDSAVDEQLLVERDILYYTNRTGNFDELIGEIREEYKDDEAFKGYWAKWCRCENVIQQHEPLYLKAAKNLSDAEAQYDEIVQFLQDIAEQKRGLALNFYKKYSRFIQEGSWIKEDYTDPNLYYLDSESTLHTSAQPKISYNINVIDVSPLPGYEDYNFDIGDKTYIEDVEFFGWSLKDLSTPYREEIIVSEIISELDAPEKNQIKVQNYKTQFEDLFQRITATTQQAEYHTGEYMRASSIVETDGSISASTLENSFANNSFKLSNARDQSVTWDESGIVTTSLTNPSEMVRIISGGIFLSTDGGQSWKTGITGSGINTSYLTSGQINTNEIYIMNGKNPAFRWDFAGLSAYSQIGNTYNLNKYVRFDEYGIYGILGKDDSWIAEDINEVHAEADFALTWQGFSLKNDNGSVKISSTDDIQVLNGEQERIKIGRISQTQTRESSTPVYGIRISKEVEVDGVVTTVPVMVTDESGELWLKNRLRVGANDTSMVEIGYLDAVRAGTGIHEVIHAGDFENENDAPFIVYEDGRVVANYIEANAGRIGNMTIAEVENLTYQAVITSNIGNTMTQGSEVILTAHLYKGAEEISSNLSYQWYYQSEEISGATDKELVINSVDFGTNGYVQYSCEITMS